MRMLKRPVERNADPCHKAIIAAEAKHEHHTELSQNVANVKDCGAPCGATTIT